MNKTLILILMMFLTACSSTGKQEGHTHDNGHEHSKFTKHLAKSVLLVTEKGLFSVEMSIPGERIKVGLNTFDLIIHNRKDKDVTGANIIVTPWMPDPKMNHGVFSPPVIIEKGNGLYTVDDVMLVMSGHWEFRINIKWGDTVTTEDNVIFDFPDVKVED